MCLLHLQRPAGSRRCFLLGPDLLDLLLQMGVAPQKPQLGNQMQFSSCQHGHCLGVALPRFDSVERTSLSRESGCGPWMCVTVGGTVCSQATGVRLSQTDSGLPTSRAAGGSEWRLD